MLAYDTSHPLQHRLGNVIDMTIGQLFLADTLYPPPFRTQLLKWIGNKQRFAHEIASHFPSAYGTYYEPFLGSGAVLGTIAPHTAIGSDAFGPLMGIWQMLHQDPDLLIAWYRERFEFFNSAPDRVAAYEIIKARYNADPNPRDFVFLSRACYGGVIRFRTDGQMSTPIGVHNPVSPESFTARVTEWHLRTQGTSFRHLDFREAIELAGPGDMIYCDPPYSNSQTILYGAQSFKLEDLVSSISAAKERGAKIALSIDGTKKSGRTVVGLEFPDGLFEREATVNCGVSMLRRFQREGEILTDENVVDRLLLTW
jgi:DNA adenine methylase